MIELIKHSTPKKRTLLDLFSGGGGMSYGFNAHPNFEIVGAVDAQQGNPSSGTGTLECNKTYFANMGLEPLEADLSSVDPKSVRQSISKHLKGRELDVLVSCAPCTGFSRVRSNNYLEDDSRNSLVVRSAHFVKEFLPEIFLMENVRELIMGRFSHHYQALKNQLENYGYEVHSSIHFLNKFGLPQRRERALIIAVKQSLELKNMEALWDGYEIDESASHVRRAIYDLPKLADGERSKKDPVHVCPRFGNDISRRRIQAISHDGGSWIDLMGHPEGEILMTPAMKRTVAKEKFGSYSDVYGRLSWDRPAVTIKRECGHVGNGRYAHPEQDRLCSVRELGILQGFPADYQFVARSITNMYRHIGDAVPPLISYQLAHLCEWMLGGVRPDIKQVVLPNTSLDTEDIQTSEQQSLYHD